MNNSLYPLLQVYGLSKSYLSGAQSQSIFKSIDIQVAQGEIIALIGASGSGKTTLLNLLSGIDSPDNGQVLLDGVDIHAQGEPGCTLLRRQHIGFVFQFFNLIPTLTVYENIALPMQLTGADNQQISSRVKRLLEQVNLSHTAKRYPETLSGGEQQRIAVARALAHKPKLVLADEPTGNLDEETGHAVISLLTDLARQHSTTLLIVTHSQQVAKAADRVLKLHHGQLQSD